MGPSPAAPGFSPHEQLNSNPATFQSNHHSILAFLPDWSGAINIAPFSG